MQGCKNLKIFKGMRLLLLTIAAFSLSLNRVDAMAAPLSEQGIELERTLGYFQFNRDVDDEEVRKVHLFT